VKSTVWVVLFLYFGAFGFADRSANAQVDNHVHDPAPAISSAATVPTATRARVLENYARLPLRFEANQGQADNRVRFLSRGSGYTLFLTPTEAVLSLSEPVGNSSDPWHLTHNQTSALRMELSGAKPDAVIAGSGEFPGRSNYFIGNDPKQWHVGVPAFGRVHYKDIYPGVDLVYYGNQRQLEYDFVIAPGANPNVIRLKVTGSRQIRIDNHGDLLIRVGAKDLRLGAPSVYQEDGSVRRPVAGKWLRSRRHELRFDLGSYDHSKALIVDPTLVYSTYLGGSLTDVATSIAVDSAGDAYIAGSTGSADFPTTQNAYQQTCKGCTGNNNAFITELDPTGSSLVYSTFLGGSNGDGANGIAIDSSGNAYVVGTTFSGEQTTIKFPTTTGAFQTACAGTCTQGDAFVTGIKEGGASLLFSSFLGGTGAEIGTAIAVLPSGDAIYVTGSTTSTDFPTKNPYQTNCSNSCTGGDAFVTVFNLGGGTLAYSTYLGGSGSDQGNGIAVDSSGSAYVAGSTNSSDFPSLNAIQSTCGGCASGIKSAFVTKFALAGTLDYSTFLGGTLYPSGAAGDSASSIAVDSAGDAYVAGSATSTDFPTVNAYQATCANGCSGGDAFVTEFNPFGSALTYSTYVGGSGADRAFAIAIDSVGNAFVTGQTSSTDFPAINTNYAFQTTCSSCASGGHDAFVAEFDVAGSGLVFSSYLGGTTKQSGNGIAINPLNGGDQATIAGATESSPFPGVSTSSFQPTFGGVEDGFIAEFPEAANCTTTHTQTGLTLSVTITCIGNFVNSSNKNNYPNQFMGFNWGDGTPETGSGSGGGSNCGVKPGICTFSATHTYAGPSSPTFGLTQTVNDASTNGTSGNNIITTGFSVTIPSTLTITPITLPSGTVGTAYTPSTLTESGGTAPYTWSIVTGSLPAGLSLNATTGVISGTPTTAGTSNFTVQVEDAEPATVTLALSILITNVPPSITTQPASQTINSGQTATMTVAASGTAPLSYQWYQGSSGVTTNPISGATGTSYTTPALTATTTYWVQVTNTAGKANSNTATITVSPVAIAPSITTQPASQTINSGQTATMTVAASGTAPLSYQWYQGSSGVTTNPISGATGTSYTTPALTATTAYWVQVTNTAGKANSNTATITVSPVAIAPSITTQPASQTINSGQTATMTVAASGTAPLSYQWYQGASGVTTNPISGATGTSYTTRALTATTTYWVLVTNSAGTANSNTATITVNVVAPPPTCAEPTVQPGTNSLTVTATSNCTDSQSSITSTTISWGDDSSSSSGTTATHTYVSAGTYTITVTATDANNLSSSASTTVAVTAPLTTSVTPGQAATQTVNVTAPPGVSSLVVTYQCVSVDGPSGVQPLGYYHLSCNINGQGVTSTVTLTSTPTPISVAVQTTSTTALQSKLQSGRVGGLYAAFLFLPGAVLMGVGLSGHRRKKMQRYAGLFLLGVMMFSWLACGGTISSPPTQNGTPAGAYSVGITGTSSGGTQTTITVGFSVTG
jgi:hypothetical protein